MATELSRDVALDTTAGQRRALEDARRRLVALAEDLRLESTTEAALLETAAGLDAVVHRIRWVADLSRHGDEP